MSVIYFICFVVYVHMFFLNTFSFTLTILPTRRLTMRKDNGHIACDNRTLSPNLYHQPGETKSRGLQQSAQNSQDLANSQISAPASSCHQPEKAKYPPQPITEDAHLPTPTTAHQGSPEAFPVLTMKLSYSSTCH